MQFVPGGPDIPEFLLQAHEEGRLVFFCGAGISYPAGLPGFQGLVEDIYDHVGATRNEIEQKAFERGQFDGTLDLLERRLPGQRIAVRTALAESLQPNIRLKGALDTHRALLTLATGAGGALRLVTTNFDRLFIAAAKRAKLDVHGYSAPMLPIPKSSRWNGLVYLHGLLPDVADESALQRLVVTSGDFGLAYLTERWAARFVTELFRNFVVCFVGYTINDPVLRYMMDALAADRMLGELVPQAYALGDFRLGNEAEKAVEWKAKGVTPILYEVPAGTHDHSALHNTLKVWAETYRDGILGKERVVVDYALSRPSASTVQDDFVGRMLWALADSSGLPAKRFADLVPTPPLDWLEAFADERFHHRDLNRFGVPPHSQEDDKLSFSLLRRPASYVNAPWMALISGGHTECRWDEVMRHIARWLLRHLNDPALMLRLVQSGGKVHDHFRWLIERELERIANLTDAELTQLLIDAPNAVPTPSMRTIWQLLLGGRVKSFQNGELYSWVKRFGVTGLTTTLRLELRELLKPRVLLRKPFRWEEGDVDGLPARDRKSVEWELVTTADHAAAALEQLRGERWEEALTTMLPDLQQLLQDALEMMRELGDASAEFDRSYWDLPSIEPHWQNKGFRQWVVLIELVRDAWNLVRNSDAIMARAIALSWFQVPFPTFKRLALFAASTGAIEPRIWSDWLTSEDGWWLWSVETQREVMRLIVGQASALPVTVKRKLERAILAGPPKHMFKSDISADSWHSIVAHSKWLRLAKLVQGGAQLGTPAAKTLATLSKSHPWKLSGNQQEEFSHWTSGTGDPGFEDTRQTDRAPRKHTDLIEWLRAEPKRKWPVDGDDWREVCRTRFSRSLFALCDLAKQKVWPIDRWREALWVWGEEGLVKKSWRYAAPVVSEMPDEVLESIAPSVASWLESASKSIETHESLLLSLCRRILELSLDPKTGITENGKPIDDSVNAAINHPVGQTTQALINFWFGQRPQDNETLASDMARLFTQVCDTGVARFRHGRVLLAANLIALFRVDRPWTEAHLLPLFDWLKPDEAKAAWEGFLWSPRLYRPLLNALKKQFLATAEHYESLTEHRQYSTFLTYVALDPFDGYSWKDFREAVAVLPQRGLEEVAHALTQALESAGDKKEESWTNRISPFWHHCWPKTLERKSGAIAEALVRLAVAAGNEFSAAYAAVSPWLMKIEYSDFVVLRLKQAGLCPRFPEQALGLLDAIVDDNSWPARELATCLNEIASAYPALKSDSRFIRLHNFVRRRGG